MIAPRLITPHLVSYLLCTTFSLLSAQAAQDPSGAPEWWERGQDTWYYKDDWKARYLSRHAGLRKTLELSQAPAKAYAYVWSSSHYTLKIDGTVIGADSDSGTIEDYDLTGVLKAGVNTIEIEGGGEVICEGSALLPTGEQIDFASDASWGGPRTQASDRRRRILDRDRYLFWRIRDPREVIRLDKDTPPRKNWRRVEHARMQPPEEEEPR